MKAFPIPFRYFYSTNSDRKDIQCHKTLLFQYKTWGSSIDLLLIFGSIIFFRSKKLKLKSVWHFDLCIGQLWNPIYSKLSHKTTEVSIFDSSRLDFNLSEHCSVGYKYFYVSWRMTKTKLISFILLQIQKSIFHSLWYTQCTR